MPRPAAALAAAVVEEVGRRVAGRAVWERRPGSVVAGRGLKAAFVGIVGLAVRRVVAAAFAVGIARVTVVGDEPAAVVGLLGRVARRDC